MRSSPFKLLAVIALFAIASIPSLHAARRTTTTNPPPTSGTIDKLIVSPM